MWSGTCNFSVNNGTCVCIPAYANVSCNYQRKQQAIAFGLTWLCVCGVCGIGRLYTGVFVGIALLILCILGILPILIGVVLSISMKFDVLKTFENSCIRTILVIMAAAAFLWFIADLIIFGTLNNGRGIIWMEMV